MFCSDVGEAMFFSLTHASPVPPHTDFGDISTQFYKLTNWFPLLILPLCRNQPLSSVLLRRHSVVPGAHYEQCSVG